MQIPPVLTAALRGTEKPPKMKILDLIDFKKVDSLLEGFNKSTGFVTAILDLEGNVLSKSGWRRICTDFHRINALTAKRCTISDTELAGKMALGEKYHFYKCLNGLVDVAVPVVINGDHIANLFSGQFFFEEPDTAFFVEQAKKYGFDEKKYIKRLKEVPVVPKDQVKPAMDFLLNMTEMIAEMTMHRISAVQFNEALKENQVQLLVQNEELKIAKEKAEESEERYRSIFENSSVAILFTTPDGKILSANDYACQIFGRSEKEICEVGRNGMVDLSDPRLPKYLNERKTNGRARGEMTFMKKDGTRFECEFSSVVFTDVYGNQRSSMVLRDLTQQKEAEQEIMALNQSLENKVTERTLQLTKANKELETFTYSVSHDLKAPLRGIDGYSKLLLDIYGQLLNEEAIHFIKTIRNSTLQMNQLIEDLLQYSRLERSQLQIRPLKINSLVDTIFKMHEDEIIAHHFSIKTNIPEIELFADPNGIQIALRNLIGNAIKFTKNVPNPEINMTLQENSDSWIISVQDNGIGFDMKYSQRIFEIFQRLQRTEDYPGTGIGLAMVAKAMQRMNGKASADSIPGNGATFFLEIPKPTK